MQEQTVELVYRIWDEPRVRPKNFVAKRVDDEADAEDVPQNVFFKIHLKGAALEPTIRNNRSRKR